MRSGSVVEVLSGKYTGRDATVVVELPGGLYRVRITGENIPLQTYCAANLVTVLSDR